MDSSKNIYLNEQNKLFEALKTTFNIGEQRKLLNDFTLKFTTLPEVWHKWLRLESANPDKNPKEFVEFANGLRKVALSHFFDEYFLFKRYVDSGVFLTHPKRNKKFRKVITCPFFSYENSYDREKDVTLLQQLQNDLQYPHRHIEAIFDRFKELSSAFVSPKMKKIFEKNYNLYKKLMEAFVNDDSDKWYKLLLTTNDDEIIVQNMEYYISKKPFQKMAWKIYIKYLKETGQEEARLNGYSRYCNFFIDDEKMKLEYKNEIKGIEENLDIINFLLDLQKLKNNYQNFINYEYVKKLTTEEEYIQTKEIAHKFREYQKSVESMESIDCSNIWFIKKEYQKKFGVKRKFFDFHNRVDDRKLTYPSHDKKIIWKKSDIKNQYFSFCTDFIRYISNDYHCRQKLYQTCKYFFAKYQTLICHHLEITQFKTSYQKNSLMLAAHNYYNYYNSSILPRMVLANALTVVSNRKLFSQILKTVKDYQIKYLTLRAQNITLEELKLLNNKNTLISIDLYYVNIFTDEKEIDIAPIEDVITCVSTLKYVKIECSSAVFTEHTAERLTNLPETTKFKKFMLYYIQPPFDGKYICEFLKKYALPNCLFCFIFDHLNFGNHQFAVDKIVTEFLKKWEPKHEVPIISCP